MGKTVRAEDLSREIQRTLKQYGDDVKEYSEETAVNTAKSTVEDLRINSPKRASAKGGKYAENWAYEKQGTGVTIYNKSPTYRLTHLLEKGHAKRNGGRVEGIVHIAPAEERAVKEYEQKLIRGL